MKVKATIALLAGALIFSVFSTQVYAQENAEQAVTQAEMNKDEPKELDICDPYERAKFIGSFCEGKKCPQEIVGAIILGFKGVCGQATWDELAMHGIFPTSLHVKPETKQ